MAVELEEKSFLDELFEDETEEEREPQIEFDGSLDQSIWAMRHVARIREKQRIIAEAAAREIKKLQDWNDSEIARLERRTEYFIAVLRQYHFSVLDEDPKQKTITLPDGKIKFRAQQPEYIKDDEQLLKWALDTDSSQTREFWKDVPKLNWGKIKETCKMVDGKLIDPETGEEVPSVEVKHRDPKFTVETEEKESQEKKPTKKDTKKSEGDDLPF